MGSRYLIAFCCVLFACSAQGPTRTQPTPAETPETCASACARFRELSCEEGTPTPEGKTCEDVCTQVGAVDISLDTACVVRSRSCDEARACEAQ